MWNVLLLSVHQESSISSFKKGIRDFLFSRNLLFSVDIDILQFFDSFFLLLRWSALYGVNDSFADHPYGTMYSLYCICILF